MTVTYNGACCDKRHGTTNVCVCVMCMFTCVFVHLCMSYVKNHHFPSASHLNLKAINGSIKHCFHFIHRIPEKLGKLDHIVIKICSWSSDAYTTLQNFEDTFFFYDAVRCYNVSNKHLIIGQVIIIWKKKNENGSPL